jgi:CDP-4-dehydro-6-deoxyglucose reductase, E1
VSNLKNKFPHVSYGKSVHGEEEIAAVVNVLRTSTQMGKHVAEFEKKIANLFNKKYGVMVNSGSSALFLAAKILNLKPGSEIITPALTFATTVSCWIQQGLTPAFVDVEPETYCIDPSKIENMISDNTRAICVPNLIGNIANWEAIDKIAKKFNLYVIEDSADTLGGKFGDNTSGFYSDISITSFYGSHIINCAGNGGILCLNSEEMAKKAKLLRSWGRSSSLFEQSEKIENRFNVKIDNIEYDSKFLFEHAGYNFEPSEAGAAFGLVQLDKLKENIKLRQYYFEQQNSYFSKYEHWFVLPKQIPNTSSGWLAYPLTVRKEAPFNRRELQIFLENRNIQTRVVFTGNIIRQPGFRNATMKTDSAGYPISDQIMEGGILLACHHGLDKDLINHVHESFTEFATLFKK